MEKKKNFVSENEKKVYLPPKIEVVEVLMEKGFAGTGDTNYGPVIGGGDVPPP